MRQTGVCLSSCPSGYYGTRSPDINKCTIIRSVVFSMYCRWMHFGGCFRTECKADCDVCFNRNFCTKCKAGLYLHMGRCLDICPDGFEANEQHMECKAIVLVCVLDIFTATDTDNSCHRHACPCMYKLPTPAYVTYLTWVHCKVGEWSQWSPCSKRGKTCGFKRGEESRTRETLRIPSASGDACPAMKEKRKCVVQRRKCRKGAQDRFIRLCHLHDRFTTAAPTTSAVPGMCRISNQTLRNCLLEAERKGGGERKRRPNKEENKEENQESRQEERDTDNREESENKNKTEHRRRKAQNKQRISTAGSSVQ
ncbi:RSPO3 protein, partial [Polyodon spathula]|nr:RSPO3 protein [Polyodon spathula]